ncbi:MAG: MBL fold metallo-hydrolase [Maricaulaceae bacterium]
MIRKYTAMFSALFTLGVTPLSFAHDTHAKPTHADATYIANEGVLVTQGDLKIMFDPFFISGFGTYTEVPEKMLAAINAQAAPFDGVDAVFVSHVHRDHFDAGAMFAYMKTNTTANVFLPEKGAQQLRELADEDDTILERLIPFALDEGSPPKQISKDGITVDAVRIPHAGYPSGRRDINNILFRVTLADGVTVAHMGDADVNDIHYAPYEDHWEKTSVDHAFPPYWYFGSQEGFDILKDRVRVKAATGVHVPINVPTGLARSGFDYFSKPGEARIITLPAPKD